MTIEPKMVDCPHGDRVALPRLQPAAMQPESRAPALRFGLRHLFWIVTADSVLLAIVAGFPEGGFGPIALLLAVAVIALHLISTAVGSHLRAEADKEVGIGRPSAGRLAAAAELVHPAVVGSASSSPMRTRGLSLRWLPLLVASGAIAGGTVGAALLEIAIGNRTTVVGVMVGAVSTAVLGGWFAFLGGNFWAILRQGWSDAVAEQNWAAARLSDRHHWAPFDLLL